MLTQRKSTATATPTTTTHTTTARLMYARYRGFCKCGRGFLAGEQIEFDPIGRHKRCRQCIEKRHSSQQFANRRVVDFDSYRGVVLRLKQIADLPRPLEPRVKDECWKLMREISTAPESSKSVKQLLESSVCCPSGDTQRFVVTLVENKRCVNCFQMQYKGELVLMDFPRRKAHCIWCECTNL